MQVNLFARPFKVFAFERRRVYLLKGGSSVWRASNSYDACFRITYRLRSTLKWKHGRHLSSFLIDALGGIDPLMI